MAETRSITMNRTRIIALSAVFGALAILFTQIFIPLFFGNPNLGSTPVTIASIFFPLPVSAMTGLIKGIGASIWTAKPYIEFPAGIGDAFMAAFTYYLSKKWRRLYAVLAGQLSRYVFTSGAIALYLGSVVSFGIASSPEQSAFLGLLGKFPWFAEAVSFLPPWLGNFMIAWIGIFPAVTLSIIANGLVCAILVQFGEKRIEKILKSGGF
jgi:hypothetical protein